MIELTELNKDLKEKLETVKKLNTEIQTKAKEVAIKNFKLQEENEALRMTSFRIHCNVCKADFSPAEAKNHTHIKQAPAGALTTTPMASASPQLIPAQQIPINLEAPQSPDAPLNLQVPPQFHVTTPEEVMDDSPTQENFNCVVCPETRKSEATLAAHMRCHEEDGAHTCNNCSYQTNDTGNIRNHSKNTHHTATIRQLACEECGMGCKTEIEMNTHIETHRGAGAPRNRCEFCDIEFTTRNDIRQHMRVAHRVLREDWEYIQSENSEQVQKVIQRVEQSLRTEQGPEQRPEQEEVQDTDGHQNEESGQGRKNCNHCETTFNNKRELTMHIKMQHFSHKPCRNLSHSDPTKRCTYGQDCADSHVPIPQGKFRCYDCGIVFNTFSEMMTHRKTNHDNTSMCQKFLRGQCNRNSRCWFSHITSASTSGQTPQDFQLRMEVPEPPINQEEKMKTILNLMMPQILSHIITQMNQN